jgi:hypothetical protein
MRNRLLTISTILLSGIAVAQTPLPGTFNSSPAQNTQQVNTNGGYIVSTPTISLGNGITPTVVTNQDTVNVSLPQNTSLSGPTVQVTNPATLNETSVATAAPATNVSNEQRVEGQASRNFDFINAPDGGGGPIVGSMADSTVSLGEVARKARNGKQIAKHSITNADVNALNGNTPDGEQPATDGTSMAAPQQTDANGNPITGTPQSNGGTAGAAQPPAYSRPSSQGPFGQPPSGSKPNAQQGPGIAPRGNPTPTPPPQNDQIKPQLPKTSTSLPLAGTVGALSAFAGVAFFKAR